MRVRNAYGEQRAHVGLDNMNLAIFARQGQHVGVCLCLWNCVACARFLLISVDKCMYVQVCVAHMCVCMTREELGPTQERPEEQIHRGSRTGTEEAVMAPGEADPCMHTCHSCTCITSRVRWRYWETVGELPSLVYEWKLDLPFAGG